MELYVCRKTSQKGFDYLVLEARAEWGRVNLTFDKTVIFEILPYGLDHRTITAEGIRIGSIEDKV